MAKKAEMKPTAETQRRREKAKTGFTELAMLPDEELIEVFKAFHAFRRETVNEFVRAKIIRHSDFELHGSSHSSRKSFMFFDIADNSTRRLISELNRFLLNVNHADCWFRAVQKYSEEDRLGLLWEFVDPHMELSVSRPYSIRNHFIFAAVYLLHYSNQLIEPNWKDDLPADGSIDFKLLEKKGNKWPCYQSFKEKMTRLDSDEFKNKTTINFRHRLQHRFRSHFDFGITPFIDRIKTENGINYAFKIIPPLDLNTLMPALYAQHQIAVEVFQSYWQMVNDLRLEWEKKYSIQWK
jgi:hypothetical protein